MEYPTGGIPRTRSLVERMMGAAMLDVSVYEEVEADQNATGQAALVVAIVAVCSAIGNYGHGGHGMIGGVLAAFFGWVVMSALTYFIGTKLFGGTADIGEMLRTLGFAQAPGVIAILGIVPFLGRLVVFAVAIWQLVTAIVAIRQALDFDTGKAIATALIAWVIVWSLMLAIFAMFFGTALLAGAVAGAAAH
jgi:hypothetical protein